MSSVTPAGSAGPSRLDGHSQLAVLVHTAGWADGLSSAACLPLPAGMPEHVGPTIQTSVADSPG